MAAIFAHFSIVAMLLILSPLHSEEAPASYEVKELGAIGEKKFFVLEGDLVTRHQAAALCQSHGYNLASIEKKEEVDYLKTFNLTDGVWTSGYGCKRPSDFVWENKNRLEDINKSAFKLTSWNCPSTDAEWCICVWTSEGELELGYKSCTGSHHKPLCQS